MNTAINTSINNLANPRLARSTFKSQVENSAIIKELYDGIVNGESEDYKTLNLLCKQTVDNGYRIILSDLLPIPFVFKFKGKSIKSLYEYEDVHIQSSIIKTLLLDGDGDLDSRVNRAIYILYNYWFFHKNNISDITLNVCVDIENIISIIIDKSLTIYREYTITGEIVDKLREKLVNEKLLNMGDV
jgi:hypothetical protein